MNLPNNFSELNDAQILYVVAKYLYTSVENIISWNYTAGGVIAKVEQTETFIPVIQSQHGKPSIGLIPTFNNLKGYNDDKYAHHISRHTKPT